MPIGVILDLHFAPEKLEAALLQLTANLQGTEQLEGTRTRPGCIGVDAYRDPEDVTRVVLFERWETEQDYANYRAWRAGDGETVLFTYTSQPTNRTILHVQPAV